MNWIDHLEQKRALLIGGIVIICLALLAVTSSRSNVSYDSFWHLKIGLDWLEHGLSPFRDHFSFVYNNAVVHSPYIFEVLIGWLVMHLGLESGLQLYKLANFIIIFLLVILFFRKLRSPVFVYCLALPLLIVLLQLRAIVRPELISYIFIVLSMMLYYRARTGLSVSNMLPIVVLMLAWANYHSPIFGYVIFIGYFIDQGLKQIQDKAPVSTWLQWLGWGLAVVAVGFLHPGFRHSLISMLFFPPEWKTLILEYQSSVIFLSVAAIYSLITITIVTMALLLRNRQIGLLFVCAFLSWYSIEMARLVTPSGIVILCIFAWAVSEMDLTSKLRQLSPALNRVAGVTVVLLFALSLTSAVNFARAFMNEKGISGLLFPVDVVDYMVKQGIKGRIFNEYNSGGYLIYRLSPESQVYIDGRTGILYPVSHFDRHEMAKRFPDILREEIEKYDINLSILENKQRNFRLVKDTGALELDFVSSKFALFRSSEPNFPTVGTLLAYPACWEADMLWEIESEQTRARSLLPGESFLLPFMDFVMEYGLAVDKNSFLHELENRKQWTDYDRQFVGHQALEQNLDTIAFDLFASIQDKEFSDYLGGAMAQVRLGDWELAETVLDEATRVSYSDNTSEISILRSLLLEIRENAEFKLFDDAYLEKLGGDLGKRGKSLSPSATDARAFCPGN